MGWEAKGLKWCRHVSQFFSDAPSGEIEQGDIGEGSHHESAGAVLGHFD